MKIGSPTSRKVLGIKHSDYVVDIGCGPFPHPRANVVVDKYIEDNTHRSGNLAIRSKQVFIEADGHNMPFEDNEFDYAICCHVLEHVDDPLQFVNEISRVSKRGYIETPSLIGEYLAPKKSHRWLILDIDGTLVFYDKSEVGFNINVDLGKIFLDYLPKQSIGWKLLQRTHTQIMTTNYEWSESIDVLVNPQDESLKRYFMEAWTDEALKRLLPQKTIGGEFKNAVSAFKDILNSVYHSKVLKKYSYAGNKPLIETNSPRSELS